jgi:hypothetical protein
MFEYEYRNRFVCYCFGGGSSQPVAATPPPPPLNTPSPPGSDSYQRFQEIRKGMITGDGTRIDNPADDKLGTVAKGANVTG